MKILAIHLKNLASLEGATEVDFTLEPLLSAGIFAITGPTGAGKSTILDALCLALYAKTPRYVLAREGGADIDIQDVPGTTISQGDVRGILRDGTAEGYARVNFVGADGQKYQSTWHVRRARGKEDGTLQQDTLELINKSTNSSFSGRKPEVLKELERLVGLNFEQFTRSVLLAQGDFTAFLKANKDQKASLLEKLTGTHIYSEISKLVYEKCRAAEGELHDLRLQMEGIPAMAEDEVGMLLGQKATLEGEIATFERQLGQINTEINWHHVLTDLESAREEAQTVWGLAATAMEEASARNMQLVQVNEVQETRGWVDTSNQGTKEQQLKSGLMAQTEEELNGLHMQMEEANQVLGDAETALAQKKEAVEQAKPQLDEARHLDTLIIENNRQITSATAEFETAAKKKSQHDRLLQEKRELAVKVSEDEKELSAWKNQYAARQNAVGDINFITSKLNEAARLMRAKKQAGIDMVNVENQSKGSGKQKEQLELQSKGKNTTLQVKQAAWDTKMGKLASVEIEILEQNKAAIDLALQDVVAAAAHWKVLYHTLSDETSLKEKLAANEIELESKADTLQKKEALVNEGRTKKDISENLLNKARLRVAEKVEELRSSLVAEEECPVCGSREHPYSGQDSVLANVLQGLEKDHLADARAYDSLIRQFSGLQETCRNLTQSIGQQRKELGAKTASVKMQTGAWQAFQVKKECDTVPDPEKTGWLEQKVKLTKAGQEELQKQIKAYNTAKHLLDKQKTEIGKLEKELGDIAETLRDIERKMLSLAEDFDRLQKELDNCQTSLDIVEQELLPYTENSGWDNNWKTNTPAFLEEANSFVKAWKDNLQKLAALSQQLNGLVVTVQGLEEQSGGIGGEVTQKEAALSGLKDNLAALLKRRRSIFNGEEAKKVEAGMGQEVLAAELSLQAAKSSQQELSTKIARAETKKGQLQGDLEKIEGSIQASSAKIANWLSVYNAGHSEPLNETKVLHLLSFSYAWVQGEQNALKAIDDDALKTLSVLKERENLVNQHLAKKLSETTLEELTDLQAGAVFKLEKTKRGKNEAVFKLEQDEENKKKIGGLAKAIEEKALSAENWGKLNDLIGSADGKKFRQIAQEYTLDVLLGYANMHLGMLTKRYSVQRIPASLGLQVIDRDMGDEVRTIFSLSGGECFLVSLSLALGLSSLSSSRMNVESLFIDEGFGSLDPLTLAVAMDALERLHNQGRKVGVISHVTEMTERIPTQIRVSKVANGKSKIEILTNLS